MNDSNKPVINEIVEYDEEIPCQIMNFRYDGHPFILGEGDSIVPLHWHPDVELNYNFVNTPKAQIDIEETPVFIPELV